MDNYKLTSLISFIVTVFVKDLLNFSIPKGFNATVSSQPTSNSFTSYTLSNLGFVSGSISYLYTSKPLADVQTSREINLKDVIAGYKFLEPLKKQEDAIYSEVWQNGVRVDTKDTLLYGRMFLPGNALEAMVARRLSPTTQLLIKCVSDSRIKNNGALTFTYQYNDGKWSSEYIYSTHEALLGFTGVYNFGAQERMADPTIPARLSFGGELFYAVLSKSPGLSTCLRYTSQSAYTGTPLTMSLLCNPLMGQISSMYSLSTKRASFGSRFDFNVYSYESDLSIGCEIWKYSSDFAKHNSYQIFNSSLSELVDPLDSPLADTDSLSSSTLLHTPNDAKSGINSLTQTNASEYKSTGLNSTAPKSSLLKDSNPNPPASSLLATTPNSNQVSSADITNDDMTIRAAVMDRNPISVDDSFFSRKYKTFLNALDRKLSDATAQLDISNDQYSNSRMMMINSDEHEHQELGVCFKGSTSLSNQTINMVWEGRFQELLLSTGFSLSFMTNTPIITTLGLAIQYSS